MFKIFVLVLMCLFGTVGVSNAQTIDTEHSNSLTTRYMGSLQGRDLYTITLSGKAYSMSPGFIIYDLKGSFISKPNWPIEWKNVRFQLDLYGQMHRIWLLEE